MKAMWVGMVALSIFGSASALAAPEIRVRWDRSSVDEPATPYYVRPAELARHEPYHHALSKKARSCVDRQLAELKASKLLIKEADRIDKVYIHVASAKSKVPAPTVTMVGKDIVLRVGGQSGECVTKSAEIRREFAEHQKSLLRREKHLSAAQRAEMSRAVKEIMESIERRMEELRVQEHSGSIRSVKQAEPAERPWSYEADLTFQKPEQRARMAR